MNSYMRIVNSPDSQSNRSSKSTAVRTSAFAFLLLLCGVVAQGCGDTTVVSGPAGPTGATGASGATGDAGSKGNAGDSGATGATGADGAQGVKGAAGDKTVVVVPVVNK